MKIEKDGIVKELTDQFMLADYINAGWRLKKEFPTIETKKQVRKIDLKKGR